MLPKGTAGDDGRRRGVEGDEGGDGVEEEEEEADLDRPGRLNLGIEIGSSSKSAEAANGRIKAASKNVTGGEGGVQTTARGVGGVVGCTALSRHTRRRGFDGAVRAATVEEERGTVAE